MIIDKTHKCARGHDRAHQRVAGIPGDGRSCSPRSSAPTVCRDRRCRPPPKLLPRATKDSGAARARVYAHAVDETRRDRTAEVDEVQVEGMMR